MNEKTGILEHKFQVSDILNKCSIKVAEVVSIVTYLDHSTEAYNPEEFTPLLMDTLPTIVKHPEYGNIIPKKIARNWIYTSAIVDIVSGIQESLISTYQCIKFQEFADYTRITPGLQRTDVENKLNAIVKKSKKLHLPKLIEEIEKHISIGFPHKKELISINAVRNCIIHNEAIVTEKNINAPHSNTLNLFYKDPVTYLMVDNKRVRLCEEMKRKPIVTQAIELELQNKCIEYRLQQKLNFDANMFNGIVFTCKQIVDILFEYSTQGKEITINEDK